ncbi:hypothetical protein BDV3_000738 [Batrachochytrium dendrobatidis]|nr:Trihydroxynaphthalene reductase [Batrachochytrium dendrobatidis]KAK5672207.1 Trihydroxynaphthalene reductase [Batrachochytrium dendrobatidis]
MASRSFTIRVPASTANLGPGFDVLGLGLSMYLTLTVTIPTQGLDEQHPFQMVLTYSGDSPSTVSLDPTKNLISQIAMYVASAHMKSLPNNISIHIDNPIPLGRGLGSSGAAVVAGVVLANTCCQLGMTTCDILDYACLIEGHPDNVAASLVGGLVTCYLGQDIASQVQQLQSQPNLFTPNQHVSVKDSDLIPRPPAGGAVMHRKLKISQMIKVVVGIPEFKLATHTARSVLPATYCRSDVVYNMQHLAMLVHALGDDIPNAKVVSSAMQDKVHQPYRQMLVPGLEQVLQLTEKELPGLLGVCLSGAGPTVLALATANFDAIGQLIVQKFEAQKDAQGHQIQARYLVLDVDHQGIVVSDR